MIHKTILFEHPSTGVRLQIAEYDFKEKFTRFGASYHCRELGKGWRLPTKLELELINNELHKKGKGNFKNSYYWSETDAINFGKWYMVINHKLNILGNMCYGTTFKDDIGGYVRAVRDFTL